MHAINIAFGLAQTLCLFLFESFWPASLSPVHFPLVHGCGEVPRKNSQKRWREIVREREDDTCDEVRMLLGTDGPRQLPILARPGRGLRSRGWMEGEQRGGRAWKLPEPASRSCSVGLKSCGGHFVSLTSAGAGRFAGEGFAGTTLFLDEGR